MSGHVHTFAGNPIDRAEHLRRDDASLADLAQREDALYLPFHQLDVGVDDQQRLTWLTADAVKNPQDAVFLGLLEGTPRFALEVEQQPAQQFADCRQIAAHLTTEHTGIVAQARATLDWHRRNQYCGLCGSPSQAERGGQIRRCSRCDNHIFPRTDPVAIMLIVDRPGGERCLLGQSQGRMARSQFYSALAGFLNQGESLEEAVRREVLEESGIEVGPVQYHSSQPWPFPSQLMMGCHGIATSLDIQVDGQEMFDVRWFTRDEVQAALDRQHPSLRVPGALAIAHHLIRSWVEGDVRL